MKLRELWPVLLRLPGSPPDRVHGHLLDTSAVHLWCNIYFHRVPGELQCPHCFRTLDARDRGRPSHLSQLRCCCKSWCKSLRGPDLGHTRAPLCLLWHTGHARPNGSGVSRNILLFFGGPSLQDDGDHCDAFCQLVILEEEDENEEKSEAMEAP
ncbi:hypothetical protein NDU88_000493 [Pleurodeles waltl]|uniref:Uncharacterized protein n=1 Tax=Pleurodeles waltl TaxID=8319 RepID=A0AAV7P3W8_PLEWA|nr:hypothetical protein NDU88_000493 [Pleurodeles waltl]